MNTDNEIKLEAEIHKLHGELKTYFEATRGETEKAMSNFQKARADLLTEKKEADRELERSRQILGVTRHQF